MESLIYLFYSVNQIVQFVINLYLIDQKQKLQIQKLSLQQVFKLLTLFVFIINSFLMASWFCSSICDGVNQSSNEIILFNNSTDEIIKYGNSLQAKKQLNLHSGFIMIKKSLYDTCLEKCQKNDKSFIDEEFPPSQKSISQNGLTQFPQLRNKTVLWKRIPELYKNCELIRDKIEPADIQQGNVGDCYFLAAISALASNENSILQIFGKKDMKSVAKNDYGIYKLVINVAGQPEQIVMDDLIPVFAMSQRPVFCKPVNNEFWMVLLQKVWAKINKSYRNIAYGNPHQVLKRFSVAPVFYQNIPYHFYREGRKQIMKQVDQFEKNLWQSILEGYSQNFPMCCASRQKINAQGIRPSHTYALLAAYEIVHKNKKIKLLKLRNPWGHTQYVGNYSESSQEWNQINLQIKNKIIQKSQDDGVFIIPFEVFLPNFESINISHFRKQYNYIFKPITLSQSQPQFLRITVEKQGEVYITFEKKYSRNQKKGQYESSGVSTILVAQEFQNGKLEYVDCALQTSLADVTVRCRRLKPGSYIVMIKNQNTRDQGGSAFYIKSIKMGTLSVYSGSSCIIEQLSTVKNFLFEFFLTHAVKFNKDKKKIGPYEDDWISKKLIPSSGYGYVCISLDKKGSKNFLISVDQNVIMEQGYKISFPPQVLQEIKNVKSSQLQFQVRPGQCLVFLFEIDFMRESLTLSFPPQGFDIKKII